MLVEAIGVLCEVRHIAQPMNESRDVRLRPLRVSRRSTARPPRAGGGDKSQDTSGWKGLLRGLLSVAKLQQDDECA